jgi:uncharacterized protein (DUF1778 family)
VVIDTPLKVIEPGVTTRCDRTARLQVRISAEMLALVKRVAEIQGRSVSNFVADAAQ